MEETLADTSVSSTKRCEHPECGKILVQRPNEHDSKFKKRRHCDIQCALTDPAHHAAEKARNAQAREEEAKHCEICEKKFYRKKMETRSVYLERPTCSVKCAGLRQRKLNEEEIKKHPKVCPICNKNFYRRISGKHVETRVKFKKRKTCGRECGNIHRLQTLGVSQSKWKSQAKKNSKPKPPSLPPVPPPPTFIPEAPKVEKTEELVWRPASLGGPFMRKVG